MKNKERLAEIKRYYQEFERYDTEYLSALGRKIDWQGDELNSVSNGFYEGGYDNTYPYDYEIQQWELKRELAFKELKEAIK